MSKKGYIVLRKSFEYNDEINSEPESGGGNPVKIFTSMKAAEDELNKLERLAWRQEEPGSYCYSLEDISSLDNDSIAEQIASIFGTNTRMSERRDELMAKLGKTLKGNALEDAVTAAIKAEFGDDEEAEELDSDWSVPKEATDEQIDRVREVFDNLNFYFIEEAPIDE
jgi:hypothetical protein